MQRAAEQHRAHFALAARNGGGTVASLRFPGRTVKGAPALAEEEA